MNSKLLPQLVAEVKEVKKLHAQQPKLEIQGSEIRKGLEVSRLAMQDVEFVNLTPYGKQWYRRADNTPEGKLKVTDAETKFERELTEVTQQILKEFVGDELLDYPNDIFSFDNYRVDCWRNFKKGIEIRHVVSNMNEKREEEFRKFSKPLSKPKLYEITQSEQDGLQLIDELIPTVKSSDAWEDLNSMFRRKHTNVGYPWFRNDRAVDPKTKLTFGQLADREAKKLSPHMVVNYPFTAFGRNQRGKARPILGGSRLQALVFNQLEAPEIAAYKEKSLIFKGYLSRDELKPWLIKMGQYAAKNNLTIINRDYSKYDTTVPQELRVLIGSISTIKAQDKKGKDIARCRILSSMKSSLIDGLSNEMYPIYGRIFSGEIDTNAVGGKINCYVTLSSLIEDNPRNKDVFWDLIKNGIPPILVMGDDNLTISLPAKKLSTIIKQRYGMVVSEEKGEANVFFLQNRVCFSKSKHELIMVTPFTRLIRTLINKERPVGLGPFGWTLATIQILSQLIEWPELMWAVTERIILPNDEYKLYLNRTWDYIIEGISKEDTDAAREQGPQFQSTLSKLDDGDPLKVDDFKSKVRQAYDLLREFYLNKSAS